MATAFWNVVMSSTKTAMFIVASIMLVSQLPFDVLPLTTSGR